MALLTLDWFDSTKSINKGNACYSKKLFQNLFIMPVLFNTISYEYMFLWIQDNLQLKFYLTFF